MSKSERGFVLFTVLLSLSMLLLLILSQMHHVLNLYQVSNKMTEKQNALHELEQTALELLKQFPGQCVHRQNGKISTKFNLNNACRKSSGDKQFWYLFEDFGAFPCMQYIQSDQAYSTHHWRLTVMDSNSKRRFVQIRFASLIAKQDCPADKVIFVKPGLLSWRTGLYAEKCTNYALMIDNKIK